MSAPTIGDKITFIIPLKYILSKYLVDKITIMMLETNPQFVSKT
jgi:hypothetical protein